MSTSQGSHRAARGGRRTALAPPPPAPAPVVLSGTFPEAFPGAFPGGFHEQLTVADGVLVEGLPARAAHAPTV
ncbi:hypothetical protein ACFRPD_18685, partial [Streptomyces cyaneofuscatus]